MTNINKSIPDQAARNEIINNLKENILVEAGAGSGKTTNMVERILSIIKQNNDSNNIAAVTFTRKAASELNERLNERLLEKLKNEVDEEKKTVLVNAQNNLQQMFVGTIHSFCARILRERPIEAELIPDFIEVDEKEEMEMADAAWQEFVALQAQKQDVDYLLLRELGIDLDSVKCAFNIVAENQDIDFPYSDVSKPNNLEAVWQLVMDFVENDAKPYIPQEMPENGWDGLQSAIKFLERYQRYSDLSLDISKYKLLEGFEKAGVTQNRWELKKGKIIKEKFTDDIQSEVKLLLNHWREHCYAPVIRFARRVAEYYADKRLVSAKLNYQDLLLKTANLLQENMEVRRYFQERFRYLLIDEFQDTDPIQAQIMFLLAAQPNANDDWQSIPLRPGALFVVGDPKQSIYRFRRADIAMFNEVQDRFEQTEKNLNLTTNFRSIDAISDYVNQMQDRFLFARERSEFQAAAVKMHTLDNYNGSALHGVYKITSDSKKKEDIIVEDATKIATFIRQALDGDIEIYNKPSNCKSQPRDFMIIVPYNDGMEVYAEKLRQLNIPFEMAGKVNLGTSNILREISILLEAIIDPADQVKLVAVLRGIFFGFSDNQLFVFKHNGGLFDYRSKVNKDIPYNEYVSFRKAYIKLKKYRFWLKKYSVMMSIEKIFEDCGAYLYPYCDNEGDHQRGTLTYIMEYLTTKTVSGANSVTDILSALKDIAKKMPEKELSLDGNAINAVQLMNLHKTKGLEAEVVFLAHPAKIVEIKPQKAILRNKNSVEGYLIAGKHNNWGKINNIIAKHVNWDKHSEFEKNFLDAEYNRLLYVAITRSKKMLIISDAPNKKVKNFWQPLLNEIKLRELTIQEKDEQNVVFHCDNDIDDESYNIFNNKKALLEHSYLEKTVTKIVKETNTKIKYHKTERGISWGLVIHAVLAEIVKALPDDLNIDELIAFNLRKEGRSQDELTIIKKIVANFLQSNWGMRIKNARQKLVEVPIAINDISDNKKCICKGVVDLALEENGEWLIIDYKTDFFASLAEKKLLEASYMKQLDMYSAFWYKITKQKVTERSIIFIQDFEGVLI